MQLGSEALPVLPPVGSDDLPQHALALSPEFQKLQHEHWPHSDWIMVDPGRFVIYRAGAGVLGFITVSQTP
jgi:hypothetical protein